VINIRTTSVVRREKYRLRWARHVAIRMKARNRILVEELQNRQNKTKEKPEQTNNKERASRQRHTQGNNKNN
jgi:hypothetical protein